MCPTQNLGILVELQKIIPAIEIESKYATEDNFVKKRMYPSAKCYLIQEAAYALKNAADQFKKLGYTIKVWDGYRPLSVQYVLWQLVPDEKYVADPAKGSKHNRGCAVDLTLLDKNGQELSMGTDFDDFTEKALRSFKNLPQEVLENRNLLQSIMEANHFIGWETEWWHFDFEGWINHPVQNVSFDDLENK